MAENVRQGKAAHRHVRGLPAGDGPQHRVRECLAAEEALQLQCVAAKRVLAADVHRQAEGPRAGHPPDPRGAAEAGRPGLGE